MVDLAAAHVPFGNQHVAQFLAALGLLGQRAFQLLGGDVPGGYQQFAQSQRVSGGDSLVLLQVEETLQLRLREHPHPDEDLAQPVAASLLLRYRLVKLVVGDLSGVDQQGAQKLPLTGRQLHRVF